MSTIFCDRCGSRIDGKPLGMHFAYGNDLSCDMRRIAKMDFCEECMAEIVEFALHKNACDECNHQVISRNRGKSPVCRRWSTGTDEADREGDDVRGKQETVSAGFFS